MRAKLTCSPAQIVVLLISIDAELTPSSVRARLIEYDRLPFSNRAIDFVRLTKFYCEFDYVRLPNPIKRVVFDWVRLDTPEQLSLS